MCVLKSLQAAIKKINPIPAKKSSVKYPPPPYSMSLDNVGPDVIKGSRRCN